MPSKVVKCSRLGASENLALIDKCDHHATVLQNLLDLRSGAYQERPQVGAHTEPVSFVTDGDVPLQGTGLTSLITTRLAFAVQAEQSPALQRRDCPRAIWRSTTSRWQNGLGRERYVRGRLSWLVAGRGVHTAEPCARSSRHCGGLFLGSVFGAFAALRGPPHPASSHSHRRGAPCRSGASAPRFRRQLLVLVNAGRLS
jgi:hypothetical protein